MANLLILATMYWPMELDSHFLSNDGSYKKDIVEKFFPVYCHFPTTAES